MPKLEHEQIIDDIREIVNNEYKKNWPETLIGIESTATIFLGYLNIMPKSLADLVIWPPDDCGPIVVEVGTMPDGKWNKVKNRKNGESVRVLRVGFDRSVSMIRQKFTEPEIALIRLLLKRLQEMSQDQSS